MNSLFFNFEKIFDNMPLAISVGVLSYLTGHDIVKIMDHSEKLNSSLTKTYSQQNLEKYTLHQIELKHGENVLAIAQEIKVINRIIFFLIKNSPRYFVLNDHLVAEPAPKRALFGGSDVCFFEINLSIFVRLA